MSKLLFFAITFLISSSFCEESSKKEDEKPDE